MQKEPKMLHYEYLKKKKMLRYGNENHSRFLHATLIQEVLYHKKNNIIFVKVRKIILLGY